LWRHAEAHMPKHRLADYTQAVMDLGATVCTRRPDCARCPLNKDCAAHAQGREPHYPQPRPRKPRPQRETRMLILQRTDGSVLLERRPAAGIWGGLWCLPELPENEQFEFHCQHALGLKVSRPQTLAILRHGFTHFDLDIQPIRLRVSRVPKNCDHSDRAWYRHTAGQSAHNDFALPAPVQKILDGLMAQESAS
jgi:A/G-specific adenine glycosylase